MDEKKRKGGRYLDKAPWLQDIAGAVCMALALSVLLTLSVRAEPATLKSQEATVYEQTSEESSPVGNLVEGGSFEYTGDVTAEDGSVWHQITVANGVTGYIRGDRELETGAPQEPAPENQGGEEPFAEEGDHGQTTENPSGGNLPEGDGAAGQSPLETPDQGAEGGEEEAPEGSDGEDGESSDEDEEDEPGDGGAVPAFHMQNNQSKKYVVNNAQKIKERENSAGLNAAVEGTVERKAGMDLTLIAGIAITLLGGATIYICWERMNRLNGGRTASERPDVSRNKVHRKTERKKHRQKRKSTKIIQGKKRN